MWTDSRKVAALKNVFGGAAVEVEDFIFISVTCGFLYLLLRGHKSADFVLVCILLFLAL